MYRKIQCRIYKYDGTYLGIIPNDNILSKINYNASLGSSQSSISLNLDYTRDEAIQMTDDIGFLGKFIEIYIVSDWHTNGKLIYSGIISTVKYPVFNETSTKLNILPLFTLFNRFDISDFFAEAFPTNKGIIEYLSTQLDLLYPAWGYDTSNVADLLNHKQSGDVAGKILAGIGKDSGLDLYYTPDRKILFGQDIGVNHQVSVACKGAVVAGEYEESIEDMINDVTYIASPFGAGDVKQVIDAESVENFGTIERDYRENITREEAVNQAVADINANGSAKITSNFKISSEYYDIDSIKPGDTMTVLNTPYDTLRSLKIESVRYNFDTIDVFFQKRDTFGKQLNKLTT